ncbi:sugar transferase [Chryseobacterium sp. CT-SW4]|uniref:sugar transferase n=1 Tax=Chryseobacterium sp. SW-1 TaxID=3157343 RepID=UPI003B02C108
MKITTYKKNKYRCLFINVSSISAKLFEDDVFNKNYKAITYNSEKANRSVFEYIHKLNIRTIIIENSDVKQLPGNLTNALIEARINGVRVYEAHTFYEHINKRIPLVKFKSDNYLSDNVFAIGLSKLSLKIKRFFDILFCIMLLPLVLPIVIISGIAVLLTSKGGIFFTQDRVGLNSKIFKIYKLRTMRKEHSGKFTSKDDFRITSVGKILRKTKVDELPQLFNVLKGDMSLIGPRPERPEYVDISNTENAYFDLRHLVKPGVTGWAQVYLPKATPKDNLKKLEYDLYYIKNYSLLLDLQILLKTIKVILTLNSN